MPQTSYTYDIDTNFSSGILNESTFRLEILNSSIAKNIVSIGRVGNILTIIFDDALSSEEKTTFDGDTLNPTGGLFAVHQPTEAFSSYTNKINYSQSLSEDEVSGNTDYHQKHSFLTDYLKAGTYKISWSYQWKISKSNADFMMQLLIDGNVVYSDQDTNHRGDTNLKQSTSNFIFHEFNSTGKHTIAVKFATSKSNASAYMGNFKIDINGVDNV